MTVKTKAILGGVIASFLTMGQGNALVNPFAKKPTPAAQAAASNVPEGYENLKSTYIYPTTQKLVNIFNSAKSPKDALDKLCGKSLMSSGEFRKNAGASCKANPHSAVIVLNICAAYPGFDKSDCAQNAKKLLWPGEENQPLNTLMMKPIKSIAVKEIGVDKFTNEFAQIKDNVKLTPAEELKKYVNPKNLPAAELAKFEMTNIRYLICKSKRSNLPISLQNMLDGGSCTAILQAAGKVKPSQGAMLQQGPSLIPMESEEQNLGKIEVDEYIAPPSNIGAQGALKDLNSGRDGMLDADRSYSSTVGNIPESNIPQIKGAQSGSSTAGQSQESQKKLLEAGKNMATAQKGLIKSLAPSKTPAIPASAKAICAKINTATPKEIRDNLVPVFLNESNPLNLDPDKQNLISRDLDTTNPRFVKRAGEDICKAMSQPSN